MQESGNRVELMKFPSTQHGTGDDATDRVHPRHGGKRFMIVDAMFLSIAFDNQSRFARSVGFGLEDPFAANHILRLFAEPFPMFRVPEETHILSGWLPTIPVDSGPTGPRGKSTDRLCSQMRYSMRRRCTPCQVIPVNAVKVFFCGHRWNSRRPVWTLLHVGLD